MTRIVDIVYIKLPEEFLVFPSIFDGCVLFNFFFVTDFHRNFKMYSFNPMSAIHLPKNCKFRKKKIFG